MSTYNLTLVSQFDDLSRNGNVLTKGIESDFLTFVQGQHSLQQRWVGIYAENRRLQDEIRTKESENKALNTKLKHAQSQISTEMSSRKKAELERDSLERQVMLVRELLTEKNNGTILTEHDREKLAFLSTVQPSHLDSPKVQGNLTVMDETQSDISYDKTEEDLLDPSFLRSGRVYKRPSAPPLDGNETQQERRKSKRRSKKRHRRSRSAVMTMELHEVPLDERKRKSSPIRTEVKRRHSDKEIKENDPESDSDVYFGSKYYRSGAQPFNTQNGNQLDGTPVMRRYTSNGKGLNRVHVFVSKTVLKPESCIPCGKRIKFGKVAMRCKDCRASAHPECKDLVPLPCVPNTQTPATVKSGLGVLADYTSVEPPMIPAIVIHCVNEIEARGLSEAGIYRVPGAESQVKELKEKFLRMKGSPNLSTVHDIHVICGCLKAFLRSLQEPVVTYALWDKFVAAAEMSDIDESNIATYQAVAELPQPNRDTMAFLILHLQRVAESEECKMPASNLAKVFGPTMVKYSTPDPEPMQMVNETKKQQMVIERLISLSPDYWAKFTSTEGVDTYGQVMTPEVRPIMTSMLGPIHSPGDNPASEKKSSNWFTPRFGSKSRAAQKTPTHFFDSPTLK